MLETIVKQKSIAVHTVCRNQLEQDATCDQFAVLGLCKLDMAGALKSQVKINTGVGNDDIQSILNRIALNALHQFAPLSRAAGGEFPLILQLDSQSETILFPHDAQPAFPSGYVRSESCPETVKQLSTSSLKVYPPSKEAISEFSDYTQQRIAWLETNVMPLLVEKMDSNHEENTVLCITGMPGSGKTTLTNLLKLRFPDSAFYSQESDRYKRSRDERINRETLLAGIHQYRIDDIADDIQKSAMRLHIVDGLYSAELNGLLKGSGIKLITISCTQDDPRYRMMSKLPEKIVTYTAIQNAVVFYYAGQLEWVDGNRYTLTADIVLDMTKMQVYYRST